MTVNRNIALASGCAVLAVALIAFFLRPTSSRSNALSAREQMMETLGSHIAKQRPKTKVLVLSNPFSKEAGPFNERSQFERAALRGLRKGVGESSVTVVFPEIRSEYLTNPQSVIIPSDSRTPLSFLMRPESVDQLAEAHPECQVIVSLIGLPVGVDQLKIWNESNPRSLALLLPDLRLLGSPAEALAAFQRGKLLAAVFEDPRSGNPLIVTRDNIGEMLEKHPQILGY